METVEMDQLIGSDLSYVNCAKDVTVLPALMSHWYFCAPHVDGLPPFCIAIM